MGARGMRRRRSDHPGDRYHLLALTTPLPGVLLNTEARFDAGDPSPVSEGKRPGYGPPATPLGELNMLLERVVE